MFGNLCHASVVGLYVVTCTRSTPNLPVIGLMEVPPAKATACSPTLAAAEDIHSLGGLFTAFQVQAASVMLIPTKKAVAINRMAELVKFEPAMANL